MERSLQKNKICSLDIKQSESVRGKRADMGIYYGDYTGDDLMVQDFEYGKQILKYKEENERLKKEILELKAWVEDLKDENELLERDIDKLEEALKQNNIVDRCWYCGGKLIWNSDFNYDEVYGEGEGVVSYLTCSNCGADVEYSLRSDEEE